VLLAIHSALRVLPQFALIEPVGRHCPEAVLRRALKEGGLRAEEAEILAHQLGVELPAEKKQRRLSRLTRKLSWGGNSLLDDADRVPEQRSSARRVLAKLLAIKPKKAAAADDAASVDARRGGSGIMAPRADAHVEHTASRRSLEDIKSASMVQLLSLLNAPSDNGAAADRASVAAWQAQLQQQMAPGQGGLNPGVAQLLGASENALARSKSTPNLAAAAHGGAGGGGHGGGHGAGAEPSSNVELAGEMLRALILKQARSGQPITPRAPSQASAHSSRGGGGDGGAQAQQAGSTSGSGWRGAHRASL